MDDNKRKLYDALSEDYDLGSFEQFSSDIQDDTKRRKLYDATVEEYDYGDYDSFSEQLGFGPGAQQALPSDESGQQQQETPEAPAAPTLDQVKGRKSLNVSRDPEIEEAYRQTMAPKQKAVEPAAEPEQAPAQPRDFGVRNYYQESKEATANQPKPSLETEKTTMERNLDAINQKLAEENFPDIEDASGNSYKIMGASGVEDNGTLHLVAKDKDGKEVELTAKDYADWMPDDSVEARNRKQMEADRAEIERLNAQIAARKGDNKDRRDKDFVGPVPPNGTSMYMRKDLEAQKQRALYRLDNNPEYQKAIAAEREQYKTQMQELDEAFRQSGGGTEGRTVGEIAGDFNPTLAAGDAQKMRNEQVYDAAARMLQDADEIMGTGLRYNKDSKNAEFLRAAGKDMANPDFWTMGLTDIVDNMTFRDVMERAVAQSEAEAKGEDFDNPLSPVEEKLVEAYLTRANAMMIRSEDQSQGSKMGKGAAESLKFMIDMALTGALGKAATATAVKVGEKTIVKGAAEAFVDKYVAKLGRKLASMEAKTAAGAAGKAALKEAGGLGIKLAGDVIETVPKVALSPLTAQSIAEQAAAFDLNKGQFENTWGQAIGKGTAYAGIEKFSELHGGIYERAAKNLFKVSGANALYKKLVSEDIRNTVKQWAKTTKTGMAAKAFAAGEYDGLFEMAEEMENAALYQLMGEENAWSDFWTRDNWLEMLGSFAPMTVFGMGANAGQNIYAQHKFEKTLGVLGEMGFDTDALRDVARTSTVKDLAAYLSEGLGSVQNGRLVGTIEGVAAGAEDKKKAAEAVGDFMKAAIQMQTLDGLYQGEQEQRMEDKKAEIQEAVGGKQFWKPDGTVEVARLATGEDVFVVSAPGRDGRVAVLHMDGTPGYISIDDLANEETMQSEYGDELTTGNEPTRKQGTVVMPMDEYLSLRVMTDRKNDEAARMETERQQQVGDISSQYQRGQTVEYPRGNETKKGQVYDTSDPDTMVILNEDGTFDYVPWEEVATWTGQAINVQTDEEKDQGIAGLLEAGDDARDDMAAAIEGGLEPGATVQGADGKTYEVMGVNKDSIDLEKGTAKFILRDEDGDFINMDLPYADFIANGAKKAADAAQQEADRLAAEQKAAEEQKKQAEAAAKAKAEEEAKKKKDPKYMQELLDNNPAEFARLNDEKNQDGGKDTQELFQNKLAQMAGELDAKEKERSASTDYGTRVKLQDEITALQKRMTQYGDVLRGYNQQGEGEAPAPAEPEPAPVQPQTPPQAPAGGASPLVMTPQERKEAAKKEAEEKMGKEVAARVEKFMNSRRVQGRKTMRRFGGKMRKAHYVLVEADAPIASHDALNGFAPISTNSRAYEEAQQKEVLRNAQRFNSDALHDMPTLRQDGLVPEGNGRTMMSQLSAANHDKGWDNDYLEALEYEADTYGFTPEDLASFEHPRVYIMFDEGEDIELTARNMNESNLDNKKGESKAQVAVRVNKLLDESRRSRENIMDDIYGVMEYDPTRMDGNKPKIPQLSEVSGRPSLVASILKNLVAAGIITESNIPNYLNERDKTGNNAFVELMENMLLGSALDEESLKILLDYSYSNSDAIKRTVARTSALLARLAGYYGEEYNLSPTLNNAIELLYRAAKYAEASKLPSTADAVDEYLKDTTSLFESGVTFDEPTIALARLIWNTKREPNGRTLYTVLGSLIDKVGRIVNSKESGDGGMFSDMEEITYDSLADLIKNTIFEQTGIKPSENGQAAENGAPQGAEQQGTRVTEAPQPETPGPGPVVNEGGPVEPAAEAAEPAGTGPESVEPEAPAEEPAPETTNLVDEDEIAALEKEIADRLRSQLNSGIDPGILVLAGRLAVAYIERGAAKIADFAKKMVSQFGDAIRDYIQDAYETARRTLRRNGKANIVSRMDPEDVVDRFDVNNFDKAPAEAAPEQPKPAAKPKAEKPKAEKPKKAKKATVESIFAEATGQETPAEEGSDEDFGGLFAQPIDNQQESEKNSRISEKESVTLREEDLGLDPSDYRTYMTPQAREFFEQRAKEDGRNFVNPHLAFVTYASESGVIIPVGELEALPEIVAKEDKIKAISRRAKEETGSEYLELTPEETQSYVDRLLSDENGSMVKKKDYSGPVARERKAFIVIGRPAAGKSSVFADPLSKRHKARIIDSDTVKPWLKGYEGGDGANYVNAASAKVADEAMLQAAMRGENIVIPKVGGASIISEIALPLRLAGYTVELCYNELPQEASIMRAAARFAEYGRYLSLQYLNSIGEKPFKTYTKFASKSIGESVNELSQEKVQELRRRFERLSGKEGGPAGTAGEARNGERPGNLDGVLQGPLGEGGFEGALDLTKQEKLFTASEWRNNDVAYGADPILVWSSESGQPFPGSDQSKKAQKEAQESFRNTVREALLKAVKTEQRPYAGIVQLRNAARDAGMEVDEKGATDSLIQELVEDAIVRAAKKVYGDGMLEDKTARERYDSIVKLYEMQPPINQRSSERIAKQQYSTPIPMGFLADMFAWSMGREVLEPTAGTGMMVFVVPNKMVHVNEIDPVRLEILRGMKFAKVTDQDATQPFPAQPKYDAIIANPPFGSAGEAKTFDGVSFSKLEHIIALNALEAMKPDGKAAIIVGGNMEYRSNGAISTDAKFYHYLYDHYNVKGIVDMDGSLYSRQGTTYPTRMILIDGKRTDDDRQRSTVYAPVKNKAPRKAETFADLYDIVNEIKKSEAKTNGYEVLRTEGPRVPDNSDTSGSADNGRRPGESGAPGNDVGAGSQRRSGERGKGAGKEISTKRGGTGEVDQPGIQLPLESGVEQGVEDVRPGSGGSDDSGREGNPAVPDRGEEGAGDTGGRVRGEVLGESGVGQPRRVEEKRDLSSDKLHYVHHSGAFSLESLAPAPMVEAMDQYLKTIEEEVGPIDEFVRKELGYPTREALYKALAAEQVDSVAMAIYQMKKGQAMIIGDQTGVGKGRQMAALIRWAVRQGKKPIFVTKNADLFSDIYRDLRDVGSADLVPFIFNQRGKDSHPEMTYEDENGDLVVAYKPFSSDEIKEHIKGASLPDGYDYAVLSYSQVSSGDDQSQTEAKRKKKDAPPVVAPKAEFLRRISNGSYLLLDESHNAAGESNTGAYFQSILKDAAAATFASATFAKRPDTMPLYAMRTAMSEAKIDTEQLIDVINKGGVALQEIMSRALTETGQMVRRERDMREVRTDWITIDDPATVATVRDRYDRTIAAFNAIIAFQEQYIEPAIAEIASDVADTGGYATARQGTKKLGVNNTHFASKTYNYTKQLMLALKDEAVVDRVIEEIKAGRHPVIALESTMESGLKADGYAEGDVVTDTTFAPSLIRGLKSCMKYDIKLGKEVLRRGVLTPEDLGSVGEQKYYELIDQIRESAKGTFLSPLDLITMRLQDAGYKVGELTGRELMVRKGEDGNYVIETRKEKNKKKSAADFNSGKVDVLILNKAASTGISLHASKTFKDQRQRVMVIAQPMSDINDYMQMIGRIDRTGQVHRGYYINLSLPVAAEQRFNMMLSTKLKSLNANTAADQEGGSGKVEAPDILNKYGDQVVVEYLRDHLDVYEKLGDDALMTSSTNGRYVEPSELEDYKPKEDDARRITGKVALLTTQEQEDFYNDVIERYNALIQYLDETGSNDLKITTLPLRAQTISKKVSSTGTDPDGDNPFAKDAYVETVEMDNLRKPMKADEVKAAIERLNGGLDKGPERLERLMAGVDADQAAKTEAENERYEKAKVRMQEEIAKFTEKVMARKKQSEEDKKKDIKEFVDEQTEKVEQKHTENLSSIAIRANGFRRKLNMFTVGNTYLVPDQLGEGVIFATSSPAIFCGFKAKEDKMTPSTTYAVFAVLDGRRKVELKLSQGYPLETIRDHTRTNWGRAREVNLDNWDASYVNSARKKGHIMTGNILQAIADTQDEFGNFPGQLVSYTDMEGNIHDGILMPDNWTPGQLRNSGLPVNTKADAILNGEDFKSTDGKVEIVSYYGPAIEIRVPKSKKEGGKYFENTELTSLGRYGGGFHTYRGKMEMTVRGEENIRKALDILSSLGVRVADENEGEDQPTTRRFRDGESGEDVRYRIREDEPPVKRETGYKVFFLPDAGELDLYPPMIANPDGAPTPVVLWLDADAAAIVGTSKTGRQKVKAGGKGTQGGSGTLANRPGWHLGEIPYALQFNRGEKVDNPLGIRNQQGEIIKVGRYFPKNFVWAEVEYAADVDYQQEAMSYGYNEAGNFQHSLAGLPYIPKDGFYIYRTNANPATDPWIITGAMRVKRLLTPSEVDEMVRKAGRAPQEREAGAITDEQINKLNEEIRRRAEVDPEVMDGYINDMADNLGVKVRIIHDLDEIKEKDERAQRRARRAKGWYDVKTGEIVLVLPNARSVADAEATVFHEAVGHKGLRGLFGESFDEWLDDVYENADPEMRRRIYAMQDSSIEDKDERRREATEEYMAEMAERGVEDGLEMSFWERVKAKFRELARALGIRLRFTDADIRYNLWKSKRRLAKKGESLLEKADRVATDQELRRAAEASYRAAAENSGPDNTPGGGVRYRFIGERGAANLDAALGPIEKEMVDMQVPAKNAILRLFGVKDTVQVEKAVTRVSNLETAKQMAGQGKDAAAIKFATGWEQGKDGKWRYEEEDVKLNADFFNEHAGKSADELKGQVFSLSDLLVHDDAYKSLVAAYPSIANIQVSLYNDSFFDIFDATRGYYDEKRNLMMLNPRGAGIIFKEDTLLEEMNSTLVHELQHIIQKIEGFAGGGNTNMVDKFGNVPALEKKRDEAKARLDSIIDSDERIQNYDAELERLREPVAEWKEWRKQLEETEDMRKYRELIDNEPEYRTVGTPKERSAIIQERVDRKFEILENNAEAKQLNEDIKQLDRDIRDEKYRLYRSIAGEVEARNVQTRMGMTYWARRTSTAESTEDVPRDQQIRVRSNGARSESRVRTSPGSDLSRSSRVLRDRAITNDTQDVALRMYGNEAMLGRNIVRELLVDQYTAVRTAMRAIEKESGKEANAKEDVTKALNQLSSKQQAASERYADKFLKPLMETVAKVAEEMDVEFEDIIQYVSLRRALEANELYAKRDAKEYYQRRHDDAVAGVESRTDLDKAAKDRMIAQLDADLQNQLNDTERGMSDKYRELRGTDGKHEGKDYGATIAWFSEYVDMAGNRTDIVPPREPGEDNMSYQRRLKKMRKPMAGAETLAGAEDLASQYIHDFETRSGGLSRELWDKINAATQEILNIEYNGHLITKEQYDDIRSRSQYYVPLRGFADMTAEDAFSYVTDDLSDTFVPALMRAGGRISKPDSPFGFIAGMAASAINEAYKNMAVQALYRFIANRKDNSLAVISDSWYVPTGRMVTMADVTAGDARMEDLGKEIWEPAYPNLDPGMDMDTQKSVADTFNADMEQKALMGQAAKGTAGLNLRNSFVFNKRANEKQHFVRVKVLGQEKFIIFRGDPRAAQAINGLLNPDTREMGAWSRGVRSVARTMAKLCTSYSVPFWFSNFFRDGQTAIINTYEKEGPDYTRKMMANIPFALGVIGAHVRGGNIHIQDSWSDAKKNRVKRLYDEYQKYAAGGAITGYSVIFNHAEYDKQFKRAIREKKSDLAEMWAWIGDTLESIGTVSEGIEQVFRFATFITSREAGRPMEQCIDDAKNVTVNFNRKGSYASMEWKDTANISTFDKKSGTYSTLGERGGVAATTERAFIWFLSQIAPWVRTRFMFVNPNIQGTYTTYSNMKVSLARTASAILGVAMTSFAVHLLSGLFAPDPDDPEEKKRRRRKIPYAHLTDYQRRSNIILPELGGVRVTIPLSQEYAPFWAIGDIMASAALREKYDQRAAWEVAKALGELAPVNAFDPTNIVPDPLQPAVEAATNTNYQGRSIFQKLYNETTPDYKRAYNGTWEPLVDLSVALNNAMGGTPNVTPEGYGRVANVPFRWNNPAAWQHVIEGMGGTTVSALGDVMELAGQLLGPEDVKLGSVPIVNRFVKDPYEWGNDWYLNTEARKFKDIATDQKKREKAHEKAGDTEALKRMYESEKWAIAELYDTQYKTDINRLEREIRDLKNSPDPTDQEYLAELQRQLESLQSALIKDVKNLLKERR